MIRFILRVTLVVCLLFSIVLLLVRAQPYDAGEHRQRFLQDQCSAACFVGIQPGVTTIEEALEHLANSKWISNVDNRTINNVSGYISWKWSDQKPTWISASREGEIWATQKQVVQIMIYGDLQLGDIRLALGMPDQEDIDKTQDRANHLFSLYTASYAQQGLMIQTWQPCNVVEPLRRPVILTYIISANPSLFPTHDALTDLYHTCAFR